MSFIQFSCQCQWVQVPIPTFPIPTVPNTNSNRNRNNLNPSPNPNSNPNPNPNPLHYPFRNVGIAVVGIAAASQCQYPKAYGPFLTDEPIQWISEPPILIPKTNSTDISRLEWPNVERCRTLTHVYRLFPRPVAACLRLTSAENEAADAVIVRTDRLRHGIDDVGRRPIAMIYRFWKQNSSL